MAKYVRTYVRYRELAETEVVVDESRQVSRRIKLNYVLHGVARVYFY